MSSVPIDQLRSRIDDRLRILIPEPTGEDARLREAMRYTVLAPGKRVRPLLTLASAIQFRGDVQLALDPACAIEIIHTASLVLDDLPCMDDADLRRGRPSAHMAFGESTALLGAVSLLAQGVAVVNAAPGVSAAIRAHLTWRLAEAVGIDGLCGGQFIDLQQKRGSQVSAEELESLNHRKTAVLFSVAVESGAMVAGANAEELKRVRAFGEHLGLAFQILDDVLDATAKREAAGKPTQADVDKENFVSKFGVDGARARVEEHFSAALDADFLPGTGDQPLRFFSLWLASNLGLKV